MHIDDIVGCEIRDEVRSNRNGLIVFTRITVKARVSGFFCGLLLS
jgi:hypothetical protein